VGSLIEFSSDALGTLELSDGMYCHDREWASITLRGRSARYTLMVALGFQRAAASGYRVPRPPSELLDLTLDHPAGLSLGDRGLALWASTRLGDARAEEFVKDLANVPTSSMSGLEGMEIAWLVLGAVAAVGAGLGAGLLLERMLAVLRSRGGKRSPLFHHTGTGRGRALLPNFATQIYSVLALADVGRITGDARAIREAQDLADLLVELRHDDAGWPWLYHAEKGVVVERYQVYSVHQDAMAPMAFFALAEATGDIGYARAGAEGLPWCFGANELGFQFYDAPNRFAHRAIRRKGWADRAELWVNTAATVTGRRGRSTLGEVEINATCRPYHLGWILEAWAGREQHIELLGVG
jgi:hypothetical protein